ncbi:MAG TPA: S9 family peptidase [Pyrinomonadaceae bacterium]|jgi:dipeptidyl aminopeptidase/acylaminoacyl peptidase|nr:S9 family peptidase [Pyrinomonadaceae bacterium]
MRTTQRRLIVFALFSCFALFWTSARAQQTSRAPREAYGIERYLNIRSAGSPALSPQGDRVAFLTNITGTAQVWMVPVGGGWPEQMTFYPDRVDFISWSPDGSGIIFGKAIGGNENSQLYWLSPDGAQIKALTDNAKVRHNFGSWSRDGKFISYASNKRNPNFFDVYVMEVASGREELVYQQDGSNQPLDWSFNNKQLIVSHESDELSLDNDLYLVDLPTKQATLLTQHQGASQFGRVHFAPDGHSILFGTDDGREFYSLAQLNLQTRRVDILDDTPWELASTQMSDDGSLFAYTINRDGYSELYVRKLDTDGKPLITTLGPKGTPVKLPGKGVASGLDFSKDNRKLVFTFNGARYNADVWLYDLKSQTLSQVTHSARGGVLPESFIEPELVHYKSFDGREIPAWYYRPQAPPGSVPTGKGASVRLPIIVSVHGGPEGQEQPTFNPNYQYFLSRGYAVLAPNVRGSTGYGKTYTHLDDVTKREDSVKDLAAAVEWLKTEGKADEHRIAIMGGSYGGYMTLAAITLYPDLWAAAVEQYGIANFETNLKNTSGYRRKQREREYGTLDKDLAFLKSISPIYRVDRIRAPLLVFQGKNDPRVPYTEAEQIVKALRDRNAPVEYTLFDDEGHGFVKLANRLVVGRKIADFLDQYMK